MWSPAMWSLNIDHIADTTFLYKIVPSVNLQKHYQINTKCIVYNTNNKHVFSQSMGKKFIVFVRISDESGANTTPVFCTDRLNTCFFLL